MSFSFVLDTREQKNKKLLGMHRWNRDSFYQINVIGSDGKRCNYQIRTRKGALAISQFVDLINDVGLGWCKHGTITKLSEKVHLLEIFSFYKLLFFLLLFFLSFSFLSLFCCFLEILYIFLFLESTALTNMAWTTMVHIIIMSRI